MKAKSGMPFAFMKAIKKCPGSYRFTNFKAMIFLITPVCFELKIRLPDRSVKNDKPLQKQTAAVFCAFMRPSKSKKNLFLRKTNIKRHFHFRVECFAVFDIILVDGSEKIT